MAEAQEQGLGIGREIGSMSVNHLENAALVVLETDSVEILGDVFLLLRNASIRLVHLGTGSQLLSHHRFFLILDVSRINGTFNELVGRITGIDGLRVLFHKGPAKIISDPYSRISLMGAAVVILPRETFAGIIDSVASMLGVASNPLLHKAWQEAGRIDVQWYRNRSGLGGLALLDAYMMAWQGCGWGRAEVHSFNEKEVSGAIRIYDSFEVWPERRSRECALTRGLLNGALCEIFGTFLDTTETSCAARNSPFCEFQFKRRAAGQGTTTASPPSSFLRTRSMSGRTLMDFSTVAF